MILELSVMAHSSNDTSTSPSRNPYSSDLWIPYVLIGVSCVIFLAVHFWCYHKRNRERYLRQREEKRVKFGLMEKRRITTLMLARYQSDLGIKEGDTENYLSQMYYDNCVDYFTDGDITNYHCLQGYADTTKSNITISETSTPTAFVGVSSLQSCEQVPKTLANSQTWPLIDDRQTAPYNAHVIPIHETKPAHMDKATANNNIKDYKCDNSTFIYSRTSLYNTCRDNAVPGRFVRQDVSNTSTVMEKKQQQFGFDTQNNPVNARGENISKASSSPNACPTVFYTDVSSACSAARYSQIRSSFKPRNSKRRYDGALLDDGNDGSYGDQYGMNYLTWECSRLDSKQACSNSYLSYGEYDDSYGYYNSDLKSFAQRTVTSQGFEGFEDERYQSSYLGRTRGGVSCSSDHQIIPLTDLRQNYVNNRCDPDGIWRANSAVHLDNPVYFQQNNRDVVWTETNIDSNAEVTASGIHTITDAGNHLSLHKHITTIPEPCRLKNMSVADTCVSNSHSIPLSGINKSNVSNSISNVQCADKDCDFDLRSTTIAEDLITEPKSVMSIIMNSQNRGNNFYNKQGNVYRGTVKDGNTFTRRTPQLRGLDPSLIFPHKHQRHAVKSD